MATGMRASAVAFAKQHIKKNPDITMSELKKLAGKKHNIYPLIIGLAKNELGMGRPKRKKAPVRRGKVGRRGPGRPPKSADPAAALENVVAHMRELEKEVASLRAALAKIGDIADRA